MPKVEQVIYLTQKRVNNDSATEIKKSSEQEVKNNYLLEEYYDANDSYQEDENIVKIKKNALKTGTKSIAQPNLTNFLSKNDEQLFNNNRPIKHHNVHGNSGVIQHRPSAAIRIQDGILKSRFTGNLIRDGIIDVNALTRNNNIINSNNSFSVPLFPLAFVFSKHSQVECCFRGLYTLQLFLYININFLPCKDKEELQIPFQNFYIFKI